MDGSDRNEPVRSTRPAARRRRPVRWLFVLALLILIGRGAGWIGGGVASTETSETGRLAAKTPPSPDAANKAGAAVKPAAAGTVPAGPDAPAPGPAGESQRHALPAVDGDRFASLVAMVETRAAERQFGSALAALEHLRGLPLDAQQQAVLAQSARQLEEALAAACTTITGMLERGEVLAAHDAAQQMLAEHRELVGPALRQARAPFAALGDVGAVPPREDAVWPQPKAMATDRLVHARLAGAVVTGRVVDSRSDEVTLRVQREQGVTYPTVRVAQCEPAGPTPEEAVEMSLAALHAGDGLLARLWLAAARARGAQALTPRAARLAELLR